MSKSSLEKEKDVESGSASVRDAHDQDGEVVVGGQLVDESGNAIQYRTCSWQKTAALLFSEYICLAIMSFPWSFSVLGLVPGIIVTIATAASVQYTSLVLWRFCLEHPEVRDVCDIGGELFAKAFGERWRKTAYNVTSVFFILNNTFIQGLHCLVGAKLLNTLTGSALCTVTFSAISAIICFCFSLPRPLAQLSGLGTFSAATMGIAVLLAIIFAGVQGTPAGYDPLTLGEPIVRVVAAKGTGYVAGMSAFLNILYTFVGQITLPSFIAEMKEPKDFPKALWAVTLAEIVIFTLCGAVMYHFIGEQYITAPAFGSLRSPYLKIAFSFAIPTIVFLGSLYASVTARFVFFRIFPPTSPHRTQNTALGWTTWAGILAATWLLAFVIAEVIPFFSDMLALMSSLFDGWFGFIFWGMAYLSLHATKEARWGTPLRSAETVLNYGLILFGLYTLVAGTYVSIESIIIDSKGGKVFSCASNGF
ncbi:hypothetical protein EXIGLDRAFT_736347 [Exidia glandulosa HHB12029]|uniref:Amino acid transporter transmembrane domain-containing protein n=1 Tax=Exidia glandulosa HHB12029 TaxID=1314781 RepID=A0A166N7Z1_EXIGL|nr:hypothetical protein EXIGLDRAFT_736347 [Exidia glandulosa HHB12029]